MAGHTIAIYLNEQGHDITAFSRRDFPYCKFVVGDVQDAVFLKKTLISGGYDIVVNCIGVLNEYAENNKAAAVYVNSYLPHLIIDILKETDTRLIHLSTDCVFSGKHGNYRENSPHDGQSFYARSKSLGEFDDNRNLVFRNSIIGPDMNDDGIGLLNWFLRQEGTIYGYKKAIWTGVTSLTLAKAAEHAAKEKISGVYHLVNNCPISKYDLLMLINKHFKDGRVNIVPDDTKANNKSLVNSRSDFSFIVPDYEQMIIEMKEWIMQHKKLYPHYIS